jgi:hypothetical protein
MAENQSEVARLLAQINTAYEAAQQGLTGLASGTARHTFINSKLERMGELHTSLRALVGEEEAIALIYKELETLPGAVKPPGEAPGSPQKKEEHTGDDMI